jgi:hypothetical protein
VDKAADTEAVAVDMAAADTAEGVAAALGAAVDTEAAALVDIEA